MTKIQDSAETIESSNVRPSIARTIANYAASHYFRQLCNLFLAFIRPKLLGPEMFGLWNLLKVIPEYASYAQLGARSSLRFTIPQAHSAGNSEEEHRIGSAGYWGGLFPNILFFILLLIGANTADFNSLERTGIAAMAVVGLVGWRYNHGMAILKSYRDFQLISRTNIYSALLKFILTIILIYLFGIYGCYLTELIVFLFAIFFIRFHFVKLPRVPFHWPTYKKIVSIGFPLMLLDGVELLIRTSDRYVIAWYGETAEVGYYGLAIMLAGFMLNLPGASREVIESELMYNLKTEESEKLFQRYTLAPMLNTAYLVPFLVGGAIFIMPVVVQWLLPRFTSGILPAQVISFAGFFMALSYGTRGMIVALGKQIQAALLTLPVAVCNLFLSAYAMKNGYDIAGVACATTISFVLHFFFLYIFVSRLINVSFKGIALGIFRLAIPFVIMCLCLYGSHFLGNLLTAPFWLQAGVKMGIFLTTILVLTYLGRHSHSIPGPWRKKA